jgi:NAD(P)-dependent dehydrogenase (short-subunit alcohol dehydrogenase family)
LFELSGRFALVTGAGQGVGAGIATTLADRGARVAVNDLDAHRADRTAQRIVDAGGVAHTVPFDVTDASEVEEGVARAEAMGGRPVDVLVNNAGVPVGMPMAEFSEMDPSVWQRFVDLNLYGSLHCIRSVLPNMRETGWGRIIQISSGAAQSGSKLGISLYGASKSAIEGFLRHLSQEVAADGITVNALALGLMNNGIPDGPDTSDLLHRLARAVPVGRLGTPEDAGAAVTYLASDEAAWMTGQVIQLNGGQITT